MIDVIFVCEGKVSVADSRIRIKMRNLKFVSLLLFIFFSSEF